MSMSDRFRCGGGGRRPRRPCRIHRAGARRCIHRARHRTAPRHGPSHHRADGRVRAISRRPWPVGAACAPHGSPARPAHRGCHAATGAGAGGDVPRFGDRSGGLRLQYRERHAARRADRCGRGNAGSHHIEGSATGHRLDDAGIAVALEDGSEVSGRLALAADGRKSRMREAAGIRMRSRAYPQVALTFTVSHTRSTRRSQPNSTPSTAPSRWCRCRATARPSSAW